jgi:hypothetical protein
MSEGKQILQLILDEIKSVRQKADDSDQRLDNIDKTLIIQEANLAEHMRRSDLLEIKTDALKAEIEPIKIRINRFDGALKLLAAVAGLAVFAVSIIEIIRFFR